MRRQPPDGRKPSSERPLTREDLLLWNYVTQQDARLPHANIDWASTADAVDSPEPAPSIALPRANPDQLASLLTLTPFTEAGQAHKCLTKGGLDRNSARRLRQGKFAIEATLDLHGMTREQARDSLTGFLGRAFEQQKRCVLVVTGKGRFRTESGNSDGILRKYLPRWLTLTPCAHWVLRHECAQPQHGGEGAFYILLRRKR